MSTTRRIVYVHGICKHEAGFSDPWWNALHPHTAAFGQGRRGPIDDPNATRHEVLWSDIVNPPSSGRIGNLGNFGKGGCIDDFTSYLLDPSIRAHILARFAGVVRPLLAQGDHLDILAHSWGSVVAYEGLRELDGKPFLGTVRNFFTIGAALSLVSVKLGLRTENKPGHKPQNVRRWININAQGDPVGGRMRDNPYAVDAEYLGAPNLGCWPFDFACAHSSYFRPANLHVNRDILAAWIHLE